MRNTHERAKHVLRPEERIYPTCFVLSQVPQPGQMSFPRKMDRPSAGREFECPRKLEIQNGERKRTEEEGRNKDEIRAKEKEEKEKTGSNVVVDVVAEIFLESIADRKKGNLTERREERSKRANVEKVSFALYTTWKGEKEKRDEAESVELVRERGRVISTLYSAEFKKILLQIQERDRERKVNGISRSRSKLTDTRVLVISNVYSDKNRD